MSQLSILVNSFWFLLSSWQRCCFNSLFNTSQLLQYTRAFLFYPGALMYWGVDCGTAVDQLLSSTGRGLLRHLGRRGRRRTLSRFIRSRLNWPYFFCRKSGDCLRSKCHWKLQMDGSWNNFCLQSNYNGTYVTQYLTLFLFLFYFYFLILALLSEFIFFSYLSIQIDSKSIVWEIHTQFWPPFFQKMNIPKYHRHINGIE